jgi:DNA ligase (NAD+)
MNNLSMPELVDFLNQCRDSYYNKAESIITDSEYDSLFDQLKKLEEQTGIVLSNSPTQTVGYEVLSKLKKVQHDIPLLSLDKTKNVNDLQNFANRGQCILMHKFDGLTVELIYDAGKLVQASTRGDGYVGEDITHNARTFKNIPLTIPYQRFLRLSGEAIIHKDDFQIINDNLPSGEKPYANARNLAAGSVRQLDSKICTDRNVAWMLWDVLEGLDDITDDPDSRESKFVTCKNLGFDVPSYVSIFKVDADVIQRSIDTMKHEAVKDGIPIDGMVLKYDSLSFSKELGGTSHHKNDGVAFKFEDEKANTILRDIEWSMGRTGQLTPVAIFDPVELDGSTVSRASVHNLSYLKDYDLNIGDEISIMKANMIIPQIFKNLSAEQRPTKLGVKFPKCCPVCGHDTCVEHVNNTDTVYCNNPNCDGKKLSSFEHFVSKSAMNIDGLSEATLERFIDCGWLNEFYDIYSLDQHRNEIVKMEGFGVRSYEKMWNAIEASKNVTFDKFIVSLGIPNIGKTASKAIVHYCGNDPDKFDQLIADGFDWSVIDDFGQVTSDSIQNWFSDLHNVEIYNKLRGCVFIQNLATNVETNNPFSGKIVVATGSLQNFTRDGITQKLEELGAKVSSSVSKKTDYVICNAPSNSGKYRKAVELDIPIITESEFLKMIGGE